MFCKGRLPVYPFCGVTLMPGDMKLDSLEKQLEA